MSCVRVGAVVALALASMAHVGSPDTFFNGQAGPYPVRVTIRLPGVVPGLAQMSVRIPGAPRDTIARVTAQAIQWNVGPEGAPPPDRALPVPGDPELYAAELWLMVATSYRVHVTVEGRNGQGTAVVPVLALATAQREMPRSLGIALAALGAFLAAGLLTIIGAAVRESVVAPGATPDPVRRRRGRIAVGAGVLLVVAVVTGGRAWWSAEAFAYAGSVLYRPFTSHASVREEAGRRLLTLTIADRRWPPPPTNTATRYNALMPDHGKLMHMFLVREPALDVFAHVHPVPATPSAESFDLELPPLPAGRYRIYGDIVHESGYAQTLVAKADLSDPRTTAHTRVDPDDSWFIGIPGSESAPVFRASDGTSIIWQRGAEPLVAGADRLLTFVARDATGAAATLEPYMGMLAHVAVTRDDGAVFAHLHPAGSISMAALQKFTASVDPHALHRARPTGSEVSIPYAFPKAGRYRLWIQMKRAGAVITAPFDADVLPGS